MKVVSWNLGHAHGPFAEWHDRAWHWLATLDPDVAMLQECVPPEWARDLWDTEVLPFTHWASAVVARHGLGMAPVPLDVTSLLGRFGSYLATVELPATDGSLLVASVHARASEAPDWVTEGHDRTVIARSTVGTPWSNDVAFAGYSDLARDRRVLVGGDWNTARYADAEGVATTDGGAFFDRAAERGWTDVTIDGEGKEGRTWYGPGGPRPYQPDHVFADAETAATQRSFAIRPSAQYLSARPALLISRFGGDGTYPVYGDVDDDGGLLSVTIEFLDPLEGAG